MSGFGYTHEYDEWNDDETMVDLGGGMVVPLRELFEDDDTAGELGVDQP